MDIPHFERQRDFQYLSVAFVTIPKQTIRDRFRNFIHAHLVAFTLDLPPNSNPGFEKVGDVIYLLQPADNRPIYIFTLEALPVRIGIAQPFGPQDVTDGRFRASRLLSDQALVRSASLLATSYEKITDELQDFIAAWSALEMFINVTFKTIYKSHWLELMQQGVPQESKPVFQRLEELVADKYGLTNKFLIISAILDGACATSDTDTFSGYKKVRDNMLHGIQAPSEFPTEGVQGLMLKYLKLHLDTKVSGAIL